MEDDYIFVEGSRYISAKKAAEITGYTSDYIGQIAREGKVRSKKIGRIRFVEEEELREYTIESDRKKSAIEKLSKFEDEDTESDVLEVSDINVRESTESVTVGDSLDTRITFASKVSFPDTKSHSSLLKGDDRQKKEQDNNSFDTEQDAFDDSWGLVTIGSKVSALAIALLIVFGPYIAKEAGVFAYISRTTATAYESFVFDAEDIAMSLYEKTEEEGFFGLVRDSLIYSEMETRDTLATSFEGYMRFGEFLRSTGGSLAARENAQGSVWYEGMLGSVQSAFSNIFGREK